MALLKIALLVMYRARVAREQAVDAPAAAEPDKANPWAAPSPT